MMTIRPTLLPGCCELQPAVQSDERGRFVKVFHESWFADLGLRTDFAEQYYSVSRRGVLRGMHFQVPPMHHAKLVCCLSGRVLDVAVDLRRESPAYGRHVCVELSAELGNMVYLDEGLAHGFYTYEDNTTLLYNVTTVYSPGHDAGIRWDSAGIPWPDDKPVLSERDRSFPGLDQFDSPFIFDPNKYR